MQLQHIFVVVIIITAVNSLVVDPLVNLKPLALITL